MAISDMAPGTDVQDIAGTQGGTRGDAQDTRAKRLRSRIARYAAGASAFALCFTFSTMILAQNLYDKPATSRFKAAPKPPDPEADAEAAAQATDYIFGIHVNTIFFVAAGIIAVLWFTVGGGRKPKVTRH